jgi:hypothetical protein
MALLLSVIQVTLDAAGVQHCESRIPVGSPTDAMSRFSYVYAMTTSQKIRRGTAFEKGE